MKKLTTTIALGATALLPVFAFAATAATVNNLYQLASFIIDIINNVAVPVVFAIAFIMFIWGVFQAFILNGGDAEKRKNGQQFILWGIVGFFLMVSVWGLVNLLVGTLNLTASGPATGLPHSPTPIVQ